MFRPSFTMEIASSHHIPWFLLRTWPAHLAAVAGVIVGLAVPGKDRKRQGAAWVEMQRCGYIYSDIYIYIVCIHMYIYIHIICIYIYIYIYRYIRTIYIYICIYALYIYTYIYVSMYIYICIWKSTQMEVSRVLSWGFTAKLSSGHERPISPLILGSFGVFEAKKPWSKVDSLPLRVWTHAWIGWA